MKITLEFNSLSDLLKELPRLSRVIETPEDSEGFVEIATADEAERDRKLKIGSAKSDTEPEEHVQTKQMPAEKPSKPKAEKNKPKAEEADEPPFDVVSATEVRAALNELMKASRRDAVKAILSSFGADNFSGLKAADYGATLDKAKAVKSMSDEEYAKEYGP